MNGKIHKTNYFLLFILFFLYGISLACEILYIKDYKDDDDKNKLLFYFFIGDLIILIIIIILSLCFGFYSLYFSSKEKLLYYVIILFIFLLLQSPILFFLYLEINEHLVEKNKIPILINFISISLQIFFCILHSVLCIAERQMIIKEIINSPLNYVDENMTEDIYKNILSQSLNPEDKRLKENLQKFLNKKRNESIFSNSSTSSKETN